MIRPTSNWMHFYVPPDSRGRRMRRLLFKVAISLTTSSAVILFLLHLKKMGIEPGA
jgi:hypothetical protein